MEVRPQSSSGRPPLVPPLSCSVAQAAAFTRQEEGLSAEFLRYFCGSLDLAAVEHLEIQVDTAARNVEPLGEHLPNLKSLKLPESSVLTLRDLGTQLTGLEILWMSRCGLQDIEGVASAFPALRELYLPFNDISDLAPLAGHSCLEVLDLEGNAIEDRDEVSSLASCPGLRELTLGGNPVLRAGPSGLARRDVLDLLPQLTVLDDVDASDHVGALDAPLRATLDPPELDEEIEFLSPPPASGGAATAARCRTGSHSSASLEDTAALAVDEEQNDLGEPVPPLASGHPLLAQRLAESLSSARGVAADPYATEPNEDELVVESLKRTRAKAPSQHAHTARPAMGATFHMAMPERRQVWTADAGLRPATAGAVRPGTASGSGAGPGVSLDDLRGAQDAASELTCGASLAGGPLAAVRQRRLQGTGVMTSRDAGMDIRELMRRYQTYNQPSCISPQELLSRQKEASGKRPCTPDVRINPGVVDSDRPQSSAGGSRGLLGRGLATPTSRASVSGGGGLAEATGGEASAASDGFDGGILE